MGPRPDVGRALGAVGAALALAIGGCSGSDPEVAAAPAAEPSHTAPTPQARADGPLPAARSTDHPSGMPRASGTPQASEGPRASGPPRAAAPRADEERYVFPIRGCKARYGRTHHDYPASDIFAAAGCRIVSVTGGVVDEVSRRDRWTPAENDGATRGGLSVSVVGDDGVRYYYSHLSSLEPEVVEGAAVAPGDRLGAVGTTGSARHTPPHLHFGLSWPTAPGVWWVRRGVLQPAPYLDAWKAGDARSPRPRIIRLREARGEVPRCTSAC